MSRQRQKTPPAAKLTATDVERLNGWTSQIATELRPEAPANTGSDGSTRVGGKGNGNRTYIITARRITSGELLKGLSQITP